jgi:glycosyltransferase involved in cell wall biosynthesis
VRVALDAGFLDLPPSGTGTYVRSLVEALAVVEPDLDLRLLRPGWDGEPSRARLRDPFPWIRRDRRVRRLAWEALGVGRAARAVRPDLLHVPHFSAPLAAGCPLVVTVHDVVPLVLPAYRASRAMRGHLALMQRTVVRARLILTPSRAAADDVSRVLGFPRDRIRVTPEAAGPEFTPGGDPAALAAVRARLGIDKRYVLNIGGLDVRKNLPALIEAFTQAMPRLEDPAQLVIAGAPHSGNPTVFPPLEPVIERLGAGPHVRLVGRVSEADKLALYQGAELYVTPSLYEGFGLTALEAMACGVPTIAANRTSLPEVVGDGGLLVEPEPEPLAAAIVAVLNDPARAADLRVRGPARAATFSWELTARLTLAAYEEAFGRQPPARRDRT